MPVSTNDVLSTRASRLQSLALTSLWIAVCFTHAAPSLAGDPTLPRLEIVLHEDVTPLADGSTFAEAHEFAINNNGTWSAVVSNTEPTPASNSLLLINGEIVLREFAPMVPGPPGTTLAAFDEMSLDNFGGGAFTVFLDGVPEENNRAIYAYLDPSQNFDDGTVLVLQKGDDTPGFPGRAFLRTFDTKTNDPGDILINAAVYIDDIPNNADQAMIILTPDAAGGVADHLVIATNGDVLPGQSSPISRFGVGVEDNAFNDQSHALFRVDFSGSDHAIFFFDGQFTKIAREGEPSPVAGRNWDELFRVYLTLNNADSYALLSGLDGDEDSNLVIVKDGQKLVQTGDSLPGIAPFQLVDISGPIFLSDQGDVVWYGRWDTPDSSINSGLFLDDQLLVQVGVSRTTDGTLITQLFSLPESSRMRMSDDGNHILMLGEITGGDEVLLRLSLGLFGDGFESGDVSMWSNAVP